MADTAGRWVPVEGNPFEKAPAAKGRWVPVESNPFAAEQPRQPGRWVPVEGNPFEGEEQAQSGKPDFVDRFVKPGMDAAASKGSTPMPMAEVVGTGVVEGAKDVARSIPYAWLGAMRGIKRGAAESLLEEGYEPEAVRAHLEHGSPLPELLSDGFDPVGSVRQFLQRQGITKSMHDAATRQEQATLENSAISDPTMQADEDYQRRLQEQGLGRRVAGGVARMVPQVAGTAAATMTGSPVAGAANIISNITGMDYEQNLKQGVPEDKAFNAAFWDAVMQAPLEQIGVGKVMGVFKPQRAILAKLKKLGEAGLTEGITEYLQAYPEKFTQLFAEQPDAESLLEVEGLVDAVANKEFQKQAGEQGLIGAAGGLLMGGPGVMIRGSEKPGQGYDPSSIPTEEVQPAPQENAAFPTQQDQFMERVGDEREVPLDLTKLERRGYPDAVNYDHETAQRDVDAQRFMAEGQPELQPVEAGPVGEQAGEALATAQEGPRPYTEEDLVPLKKRALLGIAKDMDIPKPGRMKNAALRAAILEKQSGPKWELEGRWVPVDEVPADVLEQGQPTPSPTVNEQQALPPTANGPDVQATQAGAAAHTAESLALLKKRTLLDIAKGVGVEKPGRMNNEALREAILGAQPHHTTQPPAQDAPALPHSKPQETVSETPGIEAPVAEYKGDEKPSSLITFSHDDIPRDLAYHAHYNTSHVPEDRARQERDDYVQYMQAVQDDLMKRVPQEKHGELAKELEQFKAGEIKRRHDLLHARSRTASSFITGPSNFPVERMRKRNATVDKRLNELLDWRKRSLKAIERHMGIGPGADIIHSTDKEAPAKLREKIDKLRDVQEQMKKANKEWRRTKGDVDAMDVGDTMKARVREWAESKNSTKGSQPFPGYALRNNNAKLRSAERRLAVVESQQARPGSEAAFDGGRVVDDADAGRVRVYFDAKPDAEVRGKLKKSGFRWARSAGAWQRKRTPQALEVAREIVGAQAHHVDPPLRTGLHHVDPPQAQDINFKKSDGKPFTEKSVRLVVASQLRRGVNAEAVETSPGEWGWRVVDEESPAKADIGAREKIKVSIEKAVPVSEDGSRDYDTMLAQADKLIDEEGYSVDDVYEVVGELDEAGPRARFSRRAVSTQGVRSEDVSEVVDRLQAMAVNAPDVQIVQGMNNLPVRVREEYQRRGNGIPEAVYDEATGTVFFVADNIESKSRAYALWKHEAGLHNGVRGLFSSPKHYRETMAQVYRSAPKRTLRKIEERYGFNRRTQEGREGAAEEYLASVAEKVRMGDVLAPRERSIWRKIVDAFQRGIRRIVRGGRLSDWDIAQIVHDAVRWTVTGQPTGAARDVYQRATGEAMARPAQGSARFSRGKKHRGGKRSQPWPQTEWTPESAGQQVAADMADWRRLVDGALSSTGPARGSLVVGETPDVLRKLGAKQLPMHMKRDDLEKVVKGKHGISADTIKEVPLHMWQPLMVLKSATMADSYVVLLDLDHNGENISAFVGLNVLDGRILINKVASIYDKSRKREDGSTQHVWEWVKGQIEQGNLRYWDKKRSSAWFRELSGLQLPRVMNPQSYRGVRILTEKDIVKPLGRVLYSRKEGPSLKGGVPSESQDPGFWTDLWDLMHQGAVSKGDMRVMERLFRQPYWVAKEHEQFRPFIQIEQDREAERTRALLRSWEEVDSHLKALDKEGRAILSKVIWHIEGRKIEGVTAGRFTKHGQDENGHQIYRVGKEHYEQIYKVLTDNGVPEDVARAVAHIRRSLDRDLLASYRRMCQMRVGVEDDEYIKQYRTKMGEVQNYFPHVRRGTHYARVVDKDSGETLYRKHFYALPGLKAVKATKLKRAVMKALREEFPKSNLEFQWDKNRGLPEDVYEYTIPVDAMEQIINAAIDRKGSDQEARDEIKRIMHKAVADVLKTRGWAKHTIQRQNIPGHETEDIAGVLFDYKTGLYGWLTKMDAAKAFTEELYKLKAQDTPQLYGYAARYVQDMLQNADRIDQIVSMVKAGAFIKYLGGNIKTATLNLTQNLVAGVPRLYADTSAKTAAGYFKAAVDDLAAQAKVKTLKADEAKLLEDLYYSGVTADQYMRELQGEMRGVGGMPGAVARKANQWLGLPMSIAERYNRCSLALAAYRAARDGKVTAADTLEKAGKKNGEKWSYEDAKAFAESIVYDSHFLYGKGNRPELFRGRAGNKLLSAAYTFRTFTHGLLSLWRHLLFQKGWAGRQAFAMSLMANTALGGLKSLPIYALVAGLIRQLFGEDPTEKMMQAVDNQTMRDFMVYGALAPAGVTISGSLGMELPMLDRVDVNKSAKAQANEKALEILGVPWAMLEDLADFGTYALEGKPVRALEELSPAVLTNILKAVRLHQKGAHTQSGRPINIPGETGPMKLTTGEAIAQAIGFYPLRRAKSYDMYRTVEELKAYRLSKQDKLVRAYLEAERANDPHAKRKVLDEWREWNNRMRKDGRPEYVIAGLNGLAGRRRKPRQPEKRMRPKARELRRVYGQ